jgi:hypothetical protein
MIRRATFAAVVTGPLKSAIGHGEQTLAKNRRDERSSATQRRAGKSPTKKSAGG